MTEEHNNTPLQILLLQQKGRGESKIQGIRELYPERFQIKTLDLEHPLPRILDDTSDYLPHKIQADLVLDYLLHPDLSQDLAQSCEEQGIPVIASGKKLVQNWALTPPVCCALPPSASCGEYCRLFGYPRFSLQLEGNRIAKLQVLRGAPCGATWKAADAVQGLEVQEALQKIGLQTQFFCTADPANWDPIGGKSPVHLAADLHLSALKQALKLALQQKRRVEAGLQ
ncbi:MAG: DUF166 family (seleno)protein DfsP [Desulfohalobiaceae bacterium]